MKKILVSLLILAFVALGIIYMIVPSNTIIAHKTRIPISPEAASRLMQEEEIWQKWWPESDSSRGKLEFQELRLNESVYTIDQKLYKALKIKIGNGKDTLNSLLTIIPIGYDSVQVQWMATFGNAGGPFARIRQYRKSKQIKREMGELITAMQAFLSKQENVYGMSIRRDVVIDTVIVTSIVRLPSFPSNETVDSVVNKLRAYATSQGAKEVNSPMMHVDKLREDLYRAMIAIPVDREINGNKNIEIKRMIPGYMLVSEIKGGRSTINNAIRQMEYYISDLQRTSPAIPFELIITDRTREPDTSKWITRIYYPIVL